jgi:hypothetical protein
MIGEILGIIIIILIMLGFALFGDEYDGTKYMGTFVMIIMLIGFIWVNLVPGGVVGNHYTSIVSLESNLEYSGHFILGFGNIEGRMYYYAYQELGNGQYKLIKLDIDSIIVESDNVKPHYEHIDSCWKDGPFWDCDPNPKKYIFVPVGTIKREFNI